MFLLIVECIICIIHPIPGTVILYMEPLKDDNDDFAIMKNSTIKWVIIHQMARIQTVFHLISYLQYQCLLACIFYAGYLSYIPELVTDAGSQSLGYLNRVSFNFRFVFRAFMNQSPEYVLACLIILLFLIASWGLKGNRDLV